MYDFHEYDGTQEQNSSPYFSSIVQQHNGRLCQERLLRSRNFATMVRWHYISPLCCFILCVCLWLQQAGFQMMARNEIIRGVTLPAELTMYLLHG